MDGVFVSVGVKVIVGVRVGAGVRVMVLVFVWVDVIRGVLVGFAVMVSVIVGVRVAVLGVDVAPSVDFASPWVIEAPTVFVGVAVKGTGSVAVPCGDDIGAARGVGVAFLTFCGIAGFGVVRAFGVCSTVGDVAGIKRLALEQASSVAAKSKTGKSQRFFIFTFTYF